MNWDEVLAALDTAARYKAEAFVRACRNVLQKLIAKVNGEQAQEVWWYDKNEQEYAVHRTLSRHIVIILSSLVIKSEVDYEYLAEERRRLQVVEFLIVVWLITLVHDQWHDKQDDSW